MKRLRKLTSDNSEKIKGFSNILPWLPVYLAIGGLVVGNFNSISEINARNATLQAQIGKINEDIVDLHNDIREDRGVSQQILNLMIQKGK